LTGWPEDDPIVAGLRAGLIRRSRSESADPVAHALRLAVRPIRRSTIRPGAFSTEMVAFRLDVGMRCMHVSMPSSAAVAVS
jgi:hypothetical protein